MARKEVTAAQLRELLEGEFRATAADHCLKCRVPMPFRFEAAPGAVNWRVGSISECSGLCHTILVDVAVKLAASYRLAR